MARRIYREDAEQQALIQWADLTPMPRGFALAGLKIGGLLFAIPNGGKRSKIEAARMVGLGVRPGVSDLFFSFPCGDYSGLYIEMKAPKPHNSPVSKLQAIFGTRMRAVGYHWVLCCGWDAAKEEIQAYLQVDA